jgi:hypothetical protein
LRLREKLPFLATALSVVLILISNTAAAKLVSYQGRLTTTGGAPVADSDYSVTFGLYADSLGGGALWQEIATVNTSDGLFTHLLGSQNNLPAALFEQHATLFLQLTVGGEIIQPRTRIASAASAVVADHLRITDNSGRLVGRIVADSGGTIELFDYQGDPGITLRGGLSGDSAAILPDSSVTASELLDEPGIASSKNTQIMDLLYGTMTDLAVLEIEIPADGFVVLYGKCYAVLSGTTGANGAQVQIDEDEGGSALFPYYTRAGLSGYVNTNENYFPIYVTRVYYKEAGTWQFRLEGLATNPLPALAQTWDHILTAVYYPSSYGWVSTILPSPAGFSRALPIQLNDPRAPERSGTVYDVDLRSAEDSSSGAEKRQ